MVLEREPLVTVDINELYRAWFVQGIALKVAPGALF
jgi:hypothetical protein